MILKNINLIWAVLAVFAFSGIVPVSAAQPSDRPKANIATLALLDTTARLNADAALIARLIREGADTEATGSGLGDYGWTPLMYVVRNTSSKDAAQCLIDNGANVNVTAMDGRTPLIAAAEKNSNPEILRLLLEHGADTAARDRHGKRALDYARENAKLKGTEVYDLLKESTPPLPENYIKATEDLLSNAWFASAPEVARLISEGAYVSAADQNMMTPLALAAMENPNHEVIRILIENGADASAIDALKSTPLEEAAYNNTNSQVTRIILERCADTNAMPDLAVLTGILRRAARSNSNPDVLRALIERGADVNGADEDGLTPLIIAARSNTNPDVLQLLLENGADVTVRDRDFYKSALDYAEENEVLKKAETYNIILGKIILLAEEHRRKPTKDLETAVKSAGAEEVTRLLQEGAVVNVADDYGRTPLIIAAMSNPNPEVTRILIKSGADVAIRDKSGKTALDYAKENKTLNGTKTYNLLREKTIFLLKWLNDK